MHTLELFFDLVFVFAVSQITHLLISPHGVQAYAQSGLMLVTVTWVYTSFVILSGNLALKRGELQRWMLFLGMVVFFGLSVGVPALHHGHPVAFACFLALSGCIYVVPLFSRALASNCARRSAPMNLTLLGLMVVAVLLPEPWTWVMWTLAAGALIALTGRLSGFRINPAHLAERLGLAVIISLGEAVIQAGGAIEPHLDVAHAGAAFAWLLLLFGLWWCYFGLNADTYEDALIEQPVSDEGARLARFAVGHIPLLAGIILVSAGAPHVLAEPFSRADRVGMTNLIGGVALYLVSLNVVRSICGLHQQRGVYAAALVLLGITPLLVGGTNITGLMVVIAVVLVVSFTYEPDGTHRTFHSHRTP